MLQRRLIPSLLIDRNQHLVKTTQFSNRVYIGDPRNACYVLSGFRADEILLLDIDATSEGLTPDLSLIKSIAQFASVPLTVGGGIKTLEQIDEILSLGVERVVLSSVLQRDRDFLRTAVSSFGSSSISVILNHYAYNKNTPMGCFGRFSRKVDLFPIHDLAQFCSTEGAGELIVYDVLNEGTRKGFNYDLFSSISSNLAIPTIALGGANAPEDVLQLFQCTDVAGASLGSAFVYAPHTEQVLINYRQFSSRIQSKTT